MSNPSLKQKLAARAASKSRRPVRLAMVMSDGTLEPVELDEHGAPPLSSIDVDDPSDRASLCDALRAALRRFA